MSSFVDRLRTYAMRASTPYIEPAFEGATPLNGPFFYGYASIPLAEPVATTYSFMAPFAPIRRDLYIQLAQQNNQQVVAAQAPLSNIYSGTAISGMRYTYG